jgi:hypothetical protein
VNRAPSKELFEEEILPLGEESRFRGPAPCEPLPAPAPRGAASGPRVGVEPKSTALPHDGQKRAVPETSLPQAGQLIFAAGVYHRPLPTAASGRIAIALFPLVNKVVVIPNASLRL